MWAFVLNLFVLKRASTASSHFRLTNPHSIDFTGDCQTRQGCHQAHSVVRPSCRRFPNPRSTLEFVRRVHEHYHVRVIWGGCAISPGAVLFREYESPCQGTFPSQQHRLCVLVGPIIREKAAERAVTGQKKTRIRLRPVTNPGQRQVRVPVDPFQN